MIFSSNWLFVLVGMLMIMPIGMFLIDTYFNRKEKFVERLKAKIEEKA